MKKNKFINLTPHKITVQNLNNKKFVLEPIAPVARCKVFRDLIHQGQDSPDLYITKYGETEFLPAEQSNTYFVVSAMVRQANPHRMDLCSPGELIRDEKGNPIACKGLDINLP